MKVRLITAIAKINKDGRLEEIEEHQLQNQAKAYVVTHNSIELYEPLIPEEQ